MGAETLAPVIDGRTLKILLAGIVAAACLGALLVASALLLGMSPWIGLLAGSLAAQHTFGYTVSRSTRRRGPLAINPLAMLTFGWIAITVGMLLAILVAASAFAVCVQQLHLHWILAVLVAFFVGGVRVGLDQRR